MAVAFDVPPAQVTHSRPTWRVAAAGLALALSAGMLAACGGGSTPKSTTTKSSTTSATSSTTGAATSSNTGSQYASYYKANGSATLTTAPLAMQAGNFFFKPNTLTVAKGTAVTLDIKNTTSLQHNFTLTAAKVSKTLPANSTTTVSFKAPSTAGTYYFYCNVPGHAQGGMVGKLIVH